MKTMLKLTGIALLVVLTAYTGRNYATPEDAALNCPEVEFCEQQGYNLDECVCLPIMYFVAPTGTYDWGYVDVEMSRVGYVSTEYVTVRSYLEANDRNGRVTYKVVRSEILE